MKDSPDTPGRAAWERRHPCLLASEARPFSSNRSICKTCSQGCLRSQAALPRGAALAIHTVATVEDFENLRRIDIVSVKVWLLGAMATGARLFETPNMEGETMTIFACGFSAFDGMVERALITLITVLGSALAIVVVAVAAIMRRSKSGRSE